MRFSHFGCDRDGFHPQMVITIGMDKRKRNDNDDFNNDSNPEKSTYRVSRPASEKSGKTFKNTKKSSFKVGGDTGFPAKRSESRSEDRGFKKSDSPQSGPKSRFDKSDSPRSGSKSRFDRSDSPRSESKSRFDKSDSPRSGSKSRFDRSDSPRSESKSRFDRSDSPRSESKSRFDRSDSPRSESKSRFDRSDSPRSESKSRFDRSDSPRSESKSRFDRSDSPRSESKSRFDRSDSPRSESKSRFDRPDSRERSFGAKKTFSPESSFTEGTDSFDRKPDFRKPKRPDSRPDSRSHDRGFKKSESRFDKSDSAGSSYGSRISKSDDSRSASGPRYGKSRPSKPSYESDDSSFRHDSLSSQDSSWRLNKYIANSGVCARREADVLIAEGKVKVNGQVVTEMGHKVTNKDKVTVDGSEIHPEDFTYILLNKPKNHITTVDDEKGRTTVMDLIKDATGLRVYPVGRLDRNTTGLLLLTNDGDLANRLMHPSYKVKKTYIVETDIPMTDEQMLQMRQGITLDDGIATAHEARRVPGSPNALKISIFEGRNRQIRRMIEHFKLEVIKLHRTYYAGLTVVDVRPGRWRFLKSDEVNDLRTLVKLFDLKQK
jgi:23S rRNA pseudouridine2605 synthase